MAAERIENPVKNRDGTATVSVEALWKAKAGHWRKLRRPHRAVDPQVRRPAQALVAPGSARTERVPCVAGIRLRRSVWIVAVFFATRSNGIFLVDANR